MRIAMVQGTADPERDGVAGYTAALGAALGATGVEVAAVPVGGTSVAGAARTVRRLRPDVVHLQFAPSAFGFRPWPGLLPDVAGAPFVVTLHEYGWWSAPRWGHCPLSDAGPACMRDLSAATVDVALTAQASR